jgi:predicted transcriptional regulator
MPPSPVDLEIARHHGTSVALEATAERLQASKKAPIPTPSERIYELTKENGLLRLEIRSLKQIREPIRELKEDAEFIEATLNRMVTRFNQAMERVDDDLNEALEGVQGV